LDSQAYKTNQQQINLIVNQDLPVIPLYFKPEVHLSRNDLCGNSIDSSKKNIFVNLDAWDIGTSCK